MAGREDAGTRQRILEQALGLFSTQGYSNTSVSEIAARLGFSKAALYYHFRSKDEILLELLTPLLDDLDDLADLPDDASSPAGRRAALERYLDVVLAHSRLVGMLTGDVSTLAHPAVAGRAMPAFQRFRSRVAGPDAGVEATIGVASALSVLSSVLEVVAEPNAHERDVVLRAALAALEEATARL